MVNFGTRFKTVLMSSLALWSLAGCNNSGGGSGIPKEETLFHTYDINAYPMNKVVCDPTGGGTGPTSPKQGIKAELFYRSSQQARYYKAQDYIDFTTKSDANLFFTEMFVPTRMFSQGFATQTSGVLKDDVGGKLIEYFGIKMQTNIRLSAQDPEGVYEFALLSDDGSVMKIKENGSYRTIISNDGDHPTRLGCSPDRITMNKDTKLESEVLYYQGPRFHISNVLLWRKLSEAELAGKDPKCGLTGNSTWFDPNKDSKPTSEYNNLISRGWSVVKPENFYLPDENNDQEEYNPCTTGTPPKILNFRITELTSSDVFVAWMTDIPSTSQVLIVEVATGIARLTATDNVLRKNHNLQVSGLLNPNVLYTIQAISVSEDLGRAISEPLQFATP